MPIKGFRKLMLHARSLALAISWSSSLGDTGMEKSTWNQMWVKLSRGICGWSHYSLTLIWRCLTLMNISYSASPVCDFTMAANLSSVAMLLWSHGVPTLMLFLEIRTPVEIWIQLHKSNSLYGPTNRMRLNLKETIIYPVRPTGYYNPNHMNVTNALKEV